MSRSILKKSTPLKAVHADIAEVDETSGDTVQSGEFNEPNDEANKNGAENPTPPSIPTGEVKKEGPAGKFKNKNLRAVDSIRVASDRMSTSPRTRFLKKRKQNETSSPRMSPRRGNIKEGGTCFPFPDANETSPAVPVLYAYKKRNSPTVPKESHSSPVDKDHEPAKSSDETGSVSKAAVPSLDPSPDQYETLNTPGAAANSPVTSAQSAAADDILTDERMPVGGTQDQDSVDLDTVVCGTPLDASLVDSSNKQEEASLDHNEVLSPTVPMEDNDNLDASGILSDKPAENRDQGQVISEEDSRATESPSVNMRSVENKLTSPSNEAINCLPRFSATESEMDYDEEESLV